MSLFPFFLFKVSKLDHLLERMRKKAIVKPLGIARYIHYNFWWLGQNSILRQSDTSFHSCDRRVFFSSEFSLCITCFLSFFSFAFFFLFYSKVCPEEATHFSLILFLLFWSNMHPFTYLPAQCNTLKIKVNTVAKKRNNKRIEKKKRQQKHPFSLFFTLHLPSSGYSSLLRKQDAPAKLKFTFNSLKYNSSKVTTLYFDASFLSLQMNNNKNNKNNKKSHLKVTLGNVQRRTSSFNLFSLVWWSGKWIAIQSKCGNGWEKEELSLQCSVMHLDTNTHTHSERRSRRRREIELERDREK